MIFLMSVIMYIDFSESLAPTIPSNLCPMILFIILMAICLCPFKILYYSARKWLGATLARIFMSYCYSVEFRDFFIADELNSLAYSFWTLAYFFCAYSWHWEDLGAHCSVMQMWSTPVLASVPAWWRLLQCIRRYKDSSEFVHLQNGCKYITSIAAAMTTGTRRIYPFLWLKILWIVACSINSAYTSIWDIKMDWGLLRPNSRHYLLRNELVFYKWAYYVAVPINILLRFAWTLNLANFAIHPQLLGFILAVVEALRRLQWNFFRLENEHLNNCGAYCAIKEIPLPFAITDAAKALYAEEEGSIQAPPPETDGVPHAPTMAPQPLVRHQSLLHPLQSPMDGPAGTFYARRDFENRRENIEVEEGSHPHRIARQGSVVLDALDRIRDIRDSDTSSEGSEGEENEEEGDSDSPSTLHENTVANSRL
ncbi:EXS family-domain-containing protein [Phycomyces blakesleeanus]